MLHQNYIEWGAIVSRIWFADPLKLAALDVAIALLFLPKEHAYVVFDGLGVVALLP